MVAGFYTGSRRSKDGGLGHKSLGWVNGLEDDDRAQIRYAKNRPQPGRDREPARSRAGGELTRQRNPAVGQPHKPVLDHGVTAAMLGGVERGVGGLDQVARPLRAVRLGAGHPDAGGGGLIG